MTLRYGFKRILSELTAYHPRGVRRVVFLRAEEIEREREKDKKSTNANTACCEDKCYTQNTILDTTA